MWEFPWGEWIICPLEVVSLKESHHQVERKRKQQNMIKDKNKKKCQNKILFSSTVLSQKYPFIYCLIFSENKNKNKKLTYLCVFILKYNRVIVQQLGLSHTGSLISANKEIRGNNLQRRDSQSKGGGAMISFYLRFKWTIRKCSLVIYLNWA